MNAADLLNQLRAAGVQFSVEGDRLNLDAPAGVLTDELMIDLAAAKPQIMALLANHPRAGSAARPIDVRAREMPSTCMMDQCGGIIAVKAEHYCCLRCHCWYKLKEVL